jgi:hypothetical protein
MSPKILGIVTNNGSPRTTPAAQKQKERPGHPGAL